MTDVEALREHLEGLIRLGAGEETIRLARLALRKAESIQGEHARCERSAVNRK